MIAADISRGGHLMHDDAVASHGDDLVSSAPTGRTLRLFLADGTPQGLVVAEIMNWTGKVLAAPRGRMDALLRRDEVARTGLYVLTGPDPEQPGRALAYVGETDHIRKRMQNHIRKGDKDFFERLAVIVSSDTNLTKAHVRCLESMMIRMIRTAGAVSLINGTDPEPPPLPEADRADMVFFLDQLRMVMPQLGFDLFRRPAMVSRSPAQKPPNASPLFTFSTAGASARARETEDGFVVLVGSTARRSPSATFPPGYLVLRDQLIASGALVEDTTSTELYRFAEDVVFTSPSAAASIVATRSASGPREWRFETTGQMYKDWKAADLGEG